MNLDAKAAEKYIVSLKLQKYLEKLNAEKKDIMARLLAGEDLQEKMNFINSEIARATENLETLISM